MCPWLRTVDPIRRYARPAGPDSAACGGRQMWLICAPCSLAGRCSMRGAGCAGGDGEGAIAGANGRNWRWLHCGRAAPQARQHARMIRAFLPAGSHGRYRWPV